MDQKQRFCLQREIRLGVSILADDYESALREAQNMPIEQWATIHTGAIEESYTGFGFIPPDDFDPNQPHVKVWWDESYLARGEAHYQRHVSGETYYVPYRLVRDLESLHAAFVLFTRKPDIHFADYDGEHFYTAAGQGWPASELEHYPDLDELEAFYSC